MISLTLLSRIVPLLLHAMAVVQRTQEPGLAKREKALMLTSGMLAIVEGALGKDLVNDPLVLDAMGKVIDATITLARLAEDVRERRNPIPPAAPPSWIPPAA